MGSDLLPEVSSIARGRSGRRGANRLHEFEDAHLTKSRMTEPIGGIS